MKPAAARLFVALVSLLAAVLELGAALVRLVAALLARAAVAVRPRPVAQPARLRVVRSPAQAARLAAALTGMGWPAPAVRAFVAGLGDRVEREPIEVLIREGLAKLAA